MKLYKSAHSIYKTQYHIVWITCYRRKILVLGVKSYLKMKLQEIGKSYPDWDYIEIVIRSCVPVYGYSSGIRGKCGSKNHQEKYQFLQKVYCDQKGIWSRGYFVSTANTFNTKQKKKQDKHSLSFNRTTPVKAWESMSKIGFYNIMINLLL